MLIKQFESNQKHSKKTGIIILFTLLMILPLLSAFPSAYVKMFQQEGEVNEPLILFESSEKVILDPYIALLEDKNKEWSIEDISSASVSEQFKTYYSKGRPNFGYTRSAYWVRFQVVNHTLQKEWLLEIDSPKINEVVLYQPTTSKAVESKVIGNKQPFIARDVHHRNFVYQLDISSEEVQTFYLRFATGSSMQTALTLWKPSAHSEKSLLEYALFGIIFGVSVVMAVYNLFLYFSVGDRSYLYYVLFVIFNSLLNLADTGLAYQYLWPEYVGWNLRSVVIFMGLSSVGGLLFTRSFLETEKHIPKLDFLFKPLMLANVLVIAWIMFSYRGVVNAAVLCVLLTVLLIMITAIISLSKGYHAARYFLLAWSLFLCGVFISIMVDLGIIPLTVFTKYAWQITTIIEVVLLSFALGHKFKLLREEKEKAVLESQRSQELALESLRRADQLKDEFLTNTSHELRTPLNGIIGIAETLRDGAAGSLSAKVDHHLDMIIMSGRRLANLINDILDFSKLRHDSIQLHLVPLHVAELTDVVLTICQPLVQDKQLRLVNKISSSLPLVYADENRLQQILYNLIGNAIKQTERGQIIVTAKQEEDYLIITVSDTGKGIPAEELDFIFEPFHQVNPGVSRETSGTGIGLNITKRLVELHQGQISINSIVGRGSQFSFTLPLSQEKVQAQSLSQEEIALTREAFSKPFLPEIKEIGEAVSTPIAAAHSVIAPTKDVTILIADDEPVNLQVLSNQLGLEGYRVLAVSNGEAVLNKLQEQVVDLLILDIMMPKMSGYEVCRLLRKQYSLTELPILMLTAKNQVQDKVIAFEVGANDYLTKPCAKQELLSRVQTLIQLARLNRELKQLNFLLEKKVQERTQALAKTNQRLRQANDDLSQMSQSRQHMLANISHELGTPITLIRGYLQAIEEGLISPAEPRYLDMVSKKVQVLSRLIQDLFDLSQLEAGSTYLNLQETNLAEWIEELIEQCSLIVRQGGRIFNPSAFNRVLYESWFCFLDMERLDQVFSNLLWNALKHTSEVDGEISLRIVLEPKTSEVIFHIQDNGSGIETELLPYIFERFYKKAFPSLPPEVEGTGLGLAIAKEIMLGHRGRIWVESEVNVGSTFYLALPIQHKIFEGGGTG